MDTETEDQSHEPNVVSAAPAEIRDSILVKLDEAVMKLRRFVLTELLPEYGATQEEIETMREKLNHDSILFLEPIREFLKLYMPQIEAQNINFFRALFPPQFKDVVISTPHLKKGVLFAKVFESLIKDIDQ